MLSTRVVIPMTTFMTTSMTTCLRSCHRLFTAALLAVLSSWTADVTAAVPWHADLPAASRASDASRRPVLAIFTASWSSSCSTLDRTTLASDEAVALVAACFEPVCVDVDTNPELTRRLGITKVPSACIMTADEQVLSKFELPETPAGFVATAARAAQEAAFASATRPEPNTGITTRATDTAAGPRQFAGLSVQESSSLPAFGSDDSRSLRATSGAVRGTVPPGGQAINAVAAKVRMLSDFASDADPTVGNTAAIAASFRESDPSLTTGPSAAPAPKPSAIATANPTQLSTEHQAQLSTEHQAQLSTEHQAQLSTAHQAGPSTAHQAAMQPELPASPFAAPVARPDVSPAPSTLASSAPPTTEIVPETATTPLASNTRSGTVSQTPLSIEPAAVPTATMATSAPWLNAPPREPTPATAATPPQSSPSGQPAPQTFADSRPAAPAQTPTESKSIVPQQPGQPTNGGGPTALAQTTPEAAPGTPTKTKPQSAAAAAASSLLATLQKPFGMFAKQTKPQPNPETTGLIAAVPPQDPAASPTPATATATPATADTYGSMPVGLEGYCPVTLAERGSWVEGRAQWGARHRGRTYLFASAEQQRAFLADPDRYAPALSGDDPVLAFDAGKSTPGQRRYGVTYQARTYLFATTETRDAFAANPQRYTAGAMVAESRPQTAGPVVR